jgi:hypothetical protein
VSKIQSDKKLGNLPQPTFDQSEICGFCFIERLSHANNESLIRNIQGWWKNAQFSPGIEAKEKKN